MLSTTASGRWAAVVILATTYALVGALGLALAIPPSDASPVFPAAGLALAIVLRY